jgi:hypothetical protein
MITFTRRGAQEDNIPKAEFQMITFTKRGAQEDDIPKAECSR